MKLKVYGCRGSAAFSRNSHYGGNTSCMRLTYDGGMILLDAGSGIMKLDAELREEYPGYPKNLPFSPNILISHLHLDHIIGLPSFAPVSDEDAGVRIFTCSRSDKPIKEQVFGAFLPPYWPVHMSAVAFAECIPVVGTFKIDHKITVTPFAANHPDTTQSFHITDGTKTVVHLLDHEMLPQDETDVLYEHCRHADVVVFDAAYLLRDYPAKHGWGHSTVQEGIRLAEKCGCKKMVFAHFGQEYSDADLNGLNDLFAQDDRFVLAYEGLEIEV